MVIYRVASAPGKVLMTGGYLILERPNAGIVLSTNARFYAIVKPIYEDVKPESCACVSYSFNFHASIYFAIVAIISLLLKVPRAAMNDCHVSI